LLHSAHLDLHGVSWDKRRGKRGSHHLLIHVDQHVFVDVGLEGRRIAPVGMEGILVEPYLELWGGGEKRRRRQMSISKAQAP